MLKFVLYCIKVRSCFLIHPPHFNFFLKTYFKIVHKVEIFKTFNF